MARNPRKVVGREPANVSERLKKPYARVLIPESDGSYRAEILEFPGCLAEGDSAAEAFSALEAAAESWLEAAIEMGAQIPSPFDENDYSGKLVLRLPKSLHRKAAIAAERDGVSLNQFLVASLAEHLGALAEPRSRPAGIVIFRTEVKTNHPRGNYFLDPNRTDWNRIRSTPFPSLVLNQELSYADG